MRKEKLEQIRRVIKNHKELSFWKVCALTGTDGVYCKKYLQELIKNNWIVEFQKVGSRGTFYKIKEDKR